VPKVLLAMVRSGNYILDTTIYKLDHKEAEAMWTVMRSAPDVTAQDVEAIFFRRPLHNGYAMGDTQYDFELRRWYG
jgi:hypothetical protein